MEVEPTCGTGLAEHSVLPEKLATLALAMAAVLETHQKALDLTDSVSGDEFETYQKVAEGLRNSAWHLNATGSQMAASGQIPMGRHHIEVLSSQEAHDAFANYVRVEQELLSLLHDWVERDQRMLTEMRESGAV